MTKKKELQSTDDVAQDIAVLTRPKEFTYEHCKVEFTQEQLREFSEEMARKFGELSVKEDAKKQVASQFKADIEALLNECNALATKVRNKSEYQNVKVEIEKNFEAKRVRFIRTDTGEIIRERAMTADELQTTLQIPEQE